MRSIFGLMITAVLASGCGNSDHDDRVDDVRGDLSEAGWTVLGRAEVDPGGDRDTIKVSQNDKYRKLKVTVRGGSVDMSNMVVTLADDSKVRPDLRHTFKSGSQSQSIDLPGDKRTVKRVDFDYRAMGRNSDEKRPVVTLYGQ